MTGERFKITRERIEKADENARNLAKKRWDSIAKPLGSLGKLEDAVVQMAGIYGTERVSPGKKALVVFCADNGVVAEGVTQTGQEVTAVVAGNFLRGGSCAAIMCRSCGAAIRPVDVGMATDVPGLERRKAAYGTRNFTKEPAMTREQAIGTIETGIRIAGEMKAEGYGILAAGEMGIGNTTTSSAVAAALLGLSPERTTGRGAGLSGEGLDRKVDAVRRGLALHRPDAADPLDVLQKVGGFDLAGLTGLYLGCAANRIPAVIDGFISAVAALAAVRLCPDASDYILPSHVSDEPGARLVLQALHKEPLLTCGLRLGEGSGAVALFPLLDMALRVYHEMGTFADNHIEAYVPLI